MIRATLSIAERSASPVCRGGVPTQIKMLSPARTASPAERVKARRPALRAVAKTVPIYEPHLDTVLATARSAGRLEMWLINRPPARLARGDPGGISVHPQPRLAYFR